MKKKVSIIGGGTAALFLAAFLDTGIYDVTIFEKKASLGRKFLVAGDGGFNLTHAEELSVFKSRYTPTSFLAESLDNFSNTDLRQWLSSIGIPTFIGSSGRIFPEKGIKPVAVLKCIEAHLKEKNVTFKFNKTFVAWDKAGNLKFNSGEAVTSDYTVFALGGASWKVTGSDGSWLNAFNKKGLNTLPFVPSNCAYKVNWQETFIHNNEGKPLKNITISINKKTQKGEAVITKFGLEGNAIYGLSPEIQTALASKKEAIIHVDFKPTYHLSDLINKIRQSRSNRTATLREKIKLSPPVIELIKARLAKDEFFDISTLAFFIKHFPLTIVDSAPINEAISTSGGIDLNAVDSKFELKALENSFCIGEMLDWNAPTGGYLIQA